MENTFEDYLKEARQRFCNITQKYSVKDNLELRTEIDSFLIAFDQATSKALTMHTVGCSFIAFVEGYDDYGIDGYVQESVAIKDLEKIKRYKQNSKKELTIMIRTDI